MRCEILIVGGGPAGSSCAITAAPYNDVIVVDKRRSIGEPVECAEFVPKLLLQEINFSKNCIVQEIKTIQLYTLKGLVKEFDSPGFMINRTTFDKELADQAIKKDATYLINTRCISKDKNYVILQQGNEKIRIAAQIIIGADGPNSIVGSWMNQQQKDFVLGMQVESPLLKTQESLEIHFWPEFFGGYGWLFPKGNVANVGIGIKHNRTGMDMIRQHLKDFCRYLSDQGKIINVPLSLRSGLIPCSGLFSESVSGNMMLVGDSAGQTHPITGGGIPSAVICGKIAGKIASEAIIDENIDKLADYDKKYRKIFEKELTRAVKKRAWMEKNWDTLPENIPYFWPTFKEYYE
jgi:geranylgeranyl reductase family protein